MLLHIPEIVLCLTVLLGNDVVELVGSVVVW
jgi:hypothetical protein